MQDLREVELKKRVESLAKYVTLGYLNYRKNVLRQADTDFASAESRSALVKDKVFWAAKLIETHPLTEKEEKKGDDVSERRSSCVRLA